MPRDIDRRDDDHYDVVKHARDKVYPPALALMISGFLGIVGGLGLIGFAVVFGFFMSEVADTIEKQQQAMIAQQQQAAAQQQAFGPGGPAAVPPPAPPPMPMNVKSFFAIYAATYGVWGALLAAMSAVIVIGSFRMKSLGSYGWAMTASILGIGSIITCNLLALGFGIWALVILLDPTVKDGFAEVADGTPRRTAYREDDG